MTFSLLVFAIDREVFVGNAESVSVPGADGDLQVLAYHVPLIAQLRAGDVIIRNEEGTEKKLPISGGVLEVKENKVVVLVNF